MLSNAISDQNFYMQLRKFRGRKKGLTQKDLASFVKVSVQAYRYWEDGTNKPNMQNLKRLIEGLHLHKCIEAIAEIELLWRLADLDAALDEEWLKHLFTPPPQEYIPPPTPVASPLSVFSIFHPNEHFLKPEELYGREQEFAVLMRRVQQAACTSLVGPMRIGKTWLLDYLISKVQAQLPQYKAIYVDANLPQLDTLNGFVRFVMEACEVEPPLQEQLGLGELQRLVKDLYQKGTTVVLIIDEFEAFVPRQEEFNSTFFHAMKALNHMHRLVLITSTFNPLMHISHKLGVNYNLFSHFEEINLQEFRDYEAKRFVVEKGKLAGLTQMEQDKLLECGKKLPLRLQLAGFELLMLKEHSKLYETEEYRPDDPVFWESFEAMLSRRYNNLVTV